MISDTKYVVITPVRDEAKHIEKTLSSVAAQIILPVAYIIVDDGSRDATGAIIDRFAADYSWMSAVHRDDRGFRNSAGGEIDAFYYGLKSVAVPDWEFIVKLDGDLSFDNDYFEKCIRRFNENKNLGLCGGEVFNLIEGRLYPENDPLFHVRGAVKMYRRECWDAIHGMYAMNGWDTLDEVKANMHGWKTQTFPSLKITHYRPTGAAVGAWKNAIKNGRGSYIAGYHPLYFLAKCLIRFFKKPVAIESIGLLIGFISAYWKKMLRIDDRDLIRYLRQQQMNRLLLRPGIWK